MALFEPGRVIKTDFGAPIKIVKYLASGGQGDVYIIEYGGKTKALKWYNSKTLGEPDAFYDNLKRKADKGAPDKAFLWPDAVTERTEGSFGYIMDLIPDGYYALNRILSSKYCFSSFMAEIDACISIVNSFRKLHNNGYCYAAIHDGNFFIEPLTGDVRICDNDNVAPNGTNTGIRGKPRYMAPEIVVGKGRVLPNTQSDRYSLSAILFLILFMSHPLEGKRWLVPCMTDAIAEKLYGSEPLFIYDPNDNANGPVKNIHVNVMNRWGFMPQYLKDEFLTAFSQQALKDPNRRLRELDWLKVLVRFRSDIVKCTCGNEVFIQNASTTKCDDCGKPVVIKNTIQLPGYSITAAKGSHVYRCQLGTCNADDALNPVALVVAKPDGTLGVKNMTSTIFRITTSSGRDKSVEPGMVIPFISGTVIHAYDKKIKLD